jgi:hypothetical protein
MHRFRHILTRAAAIVAITGLAALAQAQDSGKIPTGTRLTVRTTTELTSATAQPGQTWNGTLVNAVRSGGKTVAPAGSSVSGTVIEAKSSGRLKSPGILTLQVTSVNGIPVTTDTLTRDGEGHTKSNVTKIGGGTAAGALIGGLVGGGKGAAIGALAGAGAGTAGAAATGKREAKITAETALTFTVQ